MRVLVRAGTVAVLAAFPLLPTVPASADAVLQAQTAATAVHLTLTQEPASSSITQSLVDDAAAYTAGAFDSSGGSEAQSAPLFPGKLVVQGPALFCSQLISCPTAPPDYPLLADASYPRRTHAAATTDQQPVGSGPFVVTPTTATATATADGNDGATTSGGVSVLSGSPVAVSVGASRSLSRITTHAGQLVVHVESTVTDVSVGGLLHIASVASTDDVTVRPGAKPVDRPHVVVSGVTVAGTSASIDDSGVHVAGQHGPSLGRRLAQQGVSIRTVGADRADRTAVARSTATALEMSFSAPVSGAPYIPNPLSSQPPFDNVPGVNANGTYVGRLTLGAVGVVAGANAEPTFSLGGIFPLGNAGSGTSTTANGGGTTGPASLPAGALPGAPTAQAPVVSRAPGFLRGVLDAVTTDLGALYAVLALGTAMLFVGWRGMIALRQHRGVAGGRG